MQLKTRGILLHSQKQKDTSLLLKIFTREKGLILCYIKNARSKTRKTVKWQLMDLVDLDLVHTEKSDIYGLKESSYASNNASRYFDPLRIAVAYFMAEVLLKAIGDKNIPHETLFDFALNKLNELESSPQTTLFPLTFLIQLSDTLGVRPKVEKSGQVFNLTEGTIEKYPKGLQSISIPEVELLGNFFLINKFDRLPSQAERSKMLGLMLDFLRYHLPGFTELKSLSVLKEVLN